MMQQLEHLDLANTSLTILPALQLPRLLHLNMSHNMLTFLPSSSLGKSPLRNPAAPPTTPQHVTQHAHHSSPPPVSVSLLPTLQLPRLLHLNMSHNMLTTPPLHQSR